MGFRAFFLRKKYWINDFFHGSKMWKEFKDSMSLIENQDCIDNIKNKEIYVKKILEFAKHNVPFYIKQNISSLKLSDFPIVDKQIYLSDYRSFCTPIERIPFQKGALHVQKTSGSTGTPFEVLQDTRCRLRRIAIIKAENEKIGFHSFEPMMHLRAVSHYWKDGRDIKYEKDLNIWYVDNANLKENKILKIINIINIKKIKVIRGYMTTLDLITQTMEQKGIKFNHKVIFISVGELLQEKLRNRVVDYLHCDIISQYGNEENGIFGQSDINGLGRKINLNGAGCIFEILKLDKDEPAKKGEIGRIVVTDFTNYAFPMIRYEIGDLAAPCEYDSYGFIKSIDNLSGRITDMIYCTNGEYLDFFNSLPAEIYNNLYIKQYQFIQKGEKTYILRLSINDEKVKENESFFISSLKKMLGGDAEISIEWLEEIPILNSGKRKIIVNEWKKNYEKYFTNIRG